MGGIDATGAAQQANPMAANPFAAMMQQMQGQQMQGQQMQGQQDGADLEDNPVRQQMMRMRFSQQLQQLVAMGFTNETVCLRVLAQHDGRVDSAMDALLTMGDAS